MAKIEEAFKKVIGLEFNSPSNALHYNPGEHGYTYMGIYEYAHPEWSGWEIVHNALSIMDIKGASIHLYDDQELTQSVMEFYKKEFWDKMRLDEVVEQHTAEEMFVFAVNAGIGSAVKVAQRIIGVTADGILGSGTIKALNGYDRSKFDTEYDAGEIAHYEKLVAANPDFKKNMNGWRNRALAV